MFLLFSLFSPPPPHKKFDQSYIFYDIQYKWSRIRLQKHEDIQIFHIKIINFCIETIQIPKYFTLPGVTLGGEHPLAARCTGARIRKQIENVNQRLLFSRRRFKGEILSCDSLRSNFGPRDGSTARSRSRARRGFWTCRAFFG